MNKKRWKKLFMTIYMGQAFSLLGSSVAQFAVIWWLTAQTESAITLTIATIMSFLPNLLLGPFAGVWIDKYNRKTVMILADGLIALTSVLLAIVFMLNEVVPISFIFLMLFIRGIGNTFHSPALMAVIPMLVPTEKLTKAGGWGNLVVSISTMIGPALGAGLMAIWPMENIMLVDIIGALFAILCLMRVPIPNIPQSDLKVELFEDTKQGLLAMKSNIPLMKAIYPVVFASMLYMPLGSLFPLLVRLHFMGGASHNAIVEFAFSAGLLLSSLIIGIYGDNKKKFTMISMAIAVLGLAAMSGGILPANGFVLFIGCSFIMGASGTFFNIPLTAYIQETVAPEMMGKVFSLLTTAMMLATPFGLILAGPISEIIGVNMWFAYSGFIMLLTGIYCYFVTRQYN